MPPQPLKGHKYETGGGQIVFDPKALIHRPEHGLLVMRVIATWAVTDSLLSVLTAEFLHSDFEVVASMLQALAGSESRRAAIDGAAKAALSPADYNLFRAVLKVIKPSRDRRNEFAHHNWGYFTDIEDGVLLTDPKHFHLDIFQTKAERIGRRNNVFPLDRSKIFVFRKRDLEEDAKAADLACQLVKNLWDAFSDKPKASQARTALSTQPQVQQALQQLSNENDQPIHPAQPRRKPRPKR